MDELGQYYAIIFTASWFIFQERKNEYHIWLFLPEGM